MRTFYIAFALSFLCFNVRAQWALKHASSVVTNDYLICHSVINNKVYLVGSPGSGNYVYEYDATANTYTQKAAANAGFNDQASFTLNGLMYLVTLSNQTTQAYDPTLNSWISKDPNNTLNTIFTNLYPPSAYGLSFNGSLFSFGLNGKAYICGLTVIDMNTMMQSVSPYVFVFDPVNNNYNVLTVPAIATLYNMLDAAMFELNGKGYVIGTETDPATLSGGAGTFEFDPAGNFTSKNSCNCGNMGHSAFVLNNLAYLNVNNTCSDTSWVYTFDPVGNAWFPSDPIATIDSSDLKLGFAVNGKGYLGYGWRYNSSCGLNGSHTRLYEYTPAGMGISAAKEEAAFDVYPNPATSVLTIRCGASKDTNFVLTDMVGRKVLELFAAGQNEIQVNVADLPNGMYFLSGARGEMRKVVVGR